jgi:hypothetical protein
MHVPKNNNLKVNVLHKNALKCLYGFDTFSDWSGQHGIYKIRNNP